MTPAELRAALRECHMTGLAFAGLVGVTRRQVSRWLHGATPIPRYVEILVSAYFLAAPVKRERAGGNR